VVALRVSWGCTRAFDVLFDVSTPRDISQTVALLLMQGSEDGDSDTDSKAGLGKDMAFR